MSLSSYIYDNICWDKISDLINVNEVNSRVITNTVDKQEIKKTLILIGKKKTRNGYMYLIRKK